MDRVSGPPIVGGLRPRVDGGPLRRIDLVRLGELQGRVGAPDRVGSGVPRPSAALGAGRRDGRGSGPPRRRHPGRGDGGIARISVSAGFGAIGPGALASGWRALARVGPGVDLGGREISGWRLIGVRRGRRLGRPGLGRRLGVIRLRLRHRGCLLSAHTRLIRSHHHRRQPSAHPAGCRTGPWDRTLPSRWKLSRAETGWGSARRPAAPPRAGAYRSGRRVASRTVEGCP